MIRPVTSFLLVAVAKVPHIPAEVCFEIHGPNSSNITYYRDSIDPTKGRFVAHCKCNAHRNELDAFVCTRTRTSNASTTKEAQGRPT